MQKYQNSISNTLTGIPVQKATVRVQAWPGGTDVTLYSTNSLATPLPSNILTTAVDGSFWFYAPNGRYQFVVTPPGAAPSTLTDIALFDLADYAFSPSAPQFTSTVATGTPPFVVNSTTTVANLVAGGNLGRPNTAFTIGPTNCNYTTIQAALTANPTANALFLVFPGTYTNDTINFTANGQCVVGMGSGEQQVVTAASANMCAVANFANCFVRNMTINITAATSAVSAVTCVAGNAEFDECYFNVTNSTVATATQPAICSISGAGHVDFDGGDLVYTNNVTDGTGATAIKAAFLPGAGLVTCSFLSLTMSGAGQSLAMTTSYTAGAGATSVTRSDIIITDAATSNVVGYYSAGSGVLSNIQLCTFTLTGGAAASVIGIWLSGTVTVSSDYCSVDCLGGLTNYSANIGAGCTWNSSFDDFLAASGYTGAGAINYVSSPAPGQIKTTGAANIPALMPAAFKNLQLSSTGLSANISVTADKVILEDSGGSYFGVENVNLTVVMSASGANGLDTGVLAASTWYSVWVIYNPTTATTAGLASLSATAPTLPSGYTQKARVGWIRTDGTANKFPLSFIQYKNVVRYKPAAGTNLTVLPTVTSGIQGTVTTTLVQISIANFVPSTAMAVELAVYASNGTTQVGPNSVATVPGGASMYGAFTTSPQLYGRFILESLNVYYASNIAAGAIYAYGWEDNL